jgi:short-subunit dehydrogenase
VASGAAFAAMPGAAVYGATKAYVVQLTRTLRQEAEVSDVRMQALIPGLTRTNLGGAEESGFFDNFPPELIMSPDDVAQASLAGLELGELVCIPAQEQADAWDRLDGELQDLGMAVSSSRIASRYA